MFNEILTLITECWSVAGDSSTYDEVADVPQNSATPPVPAGTRPPLTPSSSTKSKSSVRTILYYMLIVHQTGSRQFNEWITPKDM